MLTIRLIRRHVLELSDLNTHKHDYEAACRLLGLKAAAYLAKSCTDVQADSVEIYTFANLKDSMNSFHELPTVGYIYMLQPQGLLHDTHLYGVDVKKILPYPDFSVWGHGRRNSLQKLC